MCRSLHPDRRTPDTVLKSAKAVNPEEFVQRLNAAIPKIVEEAKANDPAELRKKIAKLERDLAAAPTKQEPIEVPAVSKEDTQLLEAILQELDALHEALVDKSDAIKEIRGDVQAMRARLDAIKGTKTVIAMPITRWKPKIDVEHLPGGKLSSASQRILDGLAWLESIGHKSPSAVQVGAVANIDPTGGYFSNSIGPLVTDGYVTRQNGIVQLTEFGRCHARPPEIEPTLDRYHAMLCERVRKLGGSKTEQMLKAIIAHGEMTTEKLGGLANIDHTGGYFSNSIGPLSTLGLIRRHSGVITPTEILFPPGL